LIPSASALEEADLTGKLKGVLRSDSIPQMFDVINQTFTWNEISQLLSGDVKRLDSPYSGHFRFNLSVSKLSEILALEYKTYLADDILQKVDRATMSVSLEGREPFLDHRIVEFTATLPDNFKMSDDEQKAILKHIVHRYVPEEIMKRPKMGFGVPVPLWMRNELKELFMTFMSDPAIRKNPYLNFNSVVKLRERYLSGKLMNFERVWFILMFQMWYDRWMSKVS
jgi:asparagine synthase (glutamine-hydrolysing)